MVDFYIKSLSFVIEFHGDFWHANPELFGENDIHRISGMTAKEIWKNDERREKIARKALNLKKYIVVWERDYVRDKSETVKKLVEEIYEVYKNK